MAAPTFVAAGDQNNSVTTTLDVFEPAGVEAGDIVVCLIYLDNGESITNLLDFEHVTDSPWTSPSTEDVAVVWKRATGPDISEYSFGLSRTGWASGQAFAFRGAIASGYPFDTDFGFATGTITNATTGIPVDMDTAGPDRLVLLGAIPYSGDTGSFSAPAGYTLHSPGLGSANPSLATIEQSAAGNTGSVSLGLSDTGESFSSWIGALKPAVSSPSATASMAITSAITAAGSTGLARTSSMALTSTITAAGSTGLTGSSSMALGVAITASGSLGGGASGSSSMAVSASLSATGVVSELASAPLSATVSITASGYLSTAGTDIRWLRINGAWVRVPAP